MESSQRIAPPTLASSFPEKTAAYAEDTSESEVRSYCDGENPCAIFMPHLFAAAQ